MADVVLNQTIFDGDIFIVIDELKIRFRDVKKVVEFIGNAKRDAPAFQNGSEYSDACMLEINSPFIENGDLRILLSEIPLFLKKLLASYIDAKSYLEWAFCKD